MPYAPDVPETLAASLEAAGDSAGVVFPLFLGFVLVLASAWLWSLVDVLSWPGSTWENAGLSKARWVIRVAVLGILGTVLYLRGPRRALRAAYAALRWSDRRREGAGNELTGTPDQADDGQPQ